MNIGNSIQLNLSKGAMPPLFFLNKYKHIQMNILNKILSRKISSFIDSETKNFLLSEIEKIQRKHGKDVYLIVKVDGKKIKAAVATINDLSVVKVIDTFTFDM